MPEVRAHPSGPGMKESPTQEALRSIQQLVASCVAQDPDDRWSDAHDVLLQLRAIAASSNGAAPQPAIRNRERLAWSLGVLAAAIVAFAIASGIIRTSGPQSRPAVALLDIVTPERTVLARGDAPQISPDGRRVAFVASDGAGRTDPAFEGGGGGAVAAAGSAEIEAAAACGVRRLPAELPVGRDPAPALVAAIQQIEGGGLYGDGDIDATHGEAQALLPQVRDRAAGRIEAKHRAAR